MNPEHVIAAPPPDLDRAALRTGADRLVLALTDVQLDYLYRFWQVLVRWNRVHNLTAIRAGDEFLTHHLLDSLSVVRPLRQVLAQGDIDSAQVLDVGSGGGLPGIPLAIACPDLQFTMVDAVQKKAAFLSQVALELPLRNVVVRHTRVESLCGQFDVVVSRAFASLARFTACTRHLLAPGGCWLAMKGRVDVAELAELPASVIVTATLPLAVPGLDEERHLIQMQPK